jgi:uncharacterized protein (DUF433 family)
MLIAIILNTMPMTKATDWVYLSTKPGSAYRQLFIKGRNISAFTLYCMSVDGDEPGMTLDGIAADYDLPLDAVVESIAYCQSNPSELRQDWEADEALAQAADVNDPRKKLSPSPKRLSPREKARLLRP